MFQTHNSQNESFYTSLTLMIESGNCHVSLFEESILNNKQTLSVTVYSHTYCAKHSNVVSQMDIFKVISLLNKKKQVSLKLCCTNPQHKEPCTYRGENCLQPVICFFRFKTGYTEAACHEVCVRMKTGS